jgi:hypothetical protein
MLIVAKKGMERLKNNPHDNLRAVCFGWDRLIIVTRWHILLFNLYIIH